MAGSHHQSRSDTYESPESRPRTGVWCRFDDVEGGERTPRSWFERISCIEIVVGAVITIIAAVAALEQRGEELRPVDQAHRDYEADRIDVQELEHRLGFHLDDRNETIREVVEQVNNVGEETSEEIAREFESLDQVRRTDREDLTEIHAVADSTSEAVLTRVRE